MSDSDMFGHIEGERCNRNGCNGIIEEYEKEGACYCHICPPCSYCTDVRYYCPECNWDSLDEQLEYENKERKERSSGFEELFKRREACDLDNSKIDYIQKTHTHFSMKIEGVYPEGTTREDIEKKVKGSFGGRFDRFGNGKFVYIAYTD